MKYQLKNRDQIFAIVVKDYNLVEIKEFLLKHNRKIASISFSLSYTLLGDEESICTIQDTDNEEYEFLDGNVLVLRNNAILNYQSKSNFDCNFSTYETLEGYIPRCYQRKNQTLCPYVDIIKSIELCIPCLDKLIKLLDVNVGETNYKIKLKKNFDNKYSFIIIFNCGEYVMSAINLVAVGSGYIRVYDNREDFFKEYEEIK